LCCVAECYAEADPVFVDLLGGGVVKIVELDGGVDDEAAAGGDGSGGVPEDRWIDREVVDEFFLPEVAGANFSPHSPATVDTHKADRGPLLLTSGTDDHTVPLKVTKEAFGMYSEGPADTEFHIFEDRGHSLTIDNKWKDVAEVALNWFAAKGF
jgi:fermentation-respiration switch protein FrsA (DUF1100 family)